MFLFFVLKCKAGLPCTRRIPGKGLGMILKHGVEDHEAARTLGHGALGLTACLLCHPAGKLACVLGSPPGAGRENRAITQEQPAASSKQHRTEQIRCGCCQAGLQGFRGGKAARRKLSL